MQEKPREQRPAMQEEPVDEQAYPLKHSAACAGTTMVTMGLIDVLAHLGPTGLLVGGLASYVAWRHGPQLYDYVRQKFPAAPAPGDEQTEPAEEEPVYTGTRSIVDRLLGNYPLAPAQSQVTEDMQGDTSFIDREEEEALTPPISTSSFVFSSLLTSFRPSLHYIYLASLPDGTPLCCAAKDLCHVAIAGSTGHGKSSLTRLLMSQLCYAGASVLLLDPHYTAYDSETGDDWTPFTPYLVYDPMECCKYSVIDHYLQQIATVLIPQRLERRRQGKKMGKPYFVVVDELPAIVAQIKGASGYLATILRQGRKVGVFVISASQGFLIKTMFPEGDSAVRDCYQTAYDVGGDARSSLALLGIPAAKMPDVRLGKGTVMLRHGAHPARLARVPLTDNAALYRLLGPSTYVPETGDEDDDLFLEHRSPLPQRTAAPQAYGYGTRRLHAVPEPEPVEAFPMMEELPMKEPAKQVRVPTHLQAAYDAYVPGMSSSELAKDIGVSKATAARYITQLKERRLIAVS
jgi:Helicase HerA, central domain